MHRFVANVTDLPQFEVQFHKVSDTRRLNSIHTHTLSTHTHIQHKSKAAIGVCTVQTNHVIRQSFSTADILYDDLPTIVFKIVQDMEK